MKNSILTTTFLSSLVFILISCSNDDENFHHMDQGKNTISFAAVLNDLVSGREAVKQQIGNIPECSEDTPVFVEVVVTQEGNPVAGTFQQPLRLAVSQDSQGIYFTQESAELELVPGVYSLDYFRVLKENEQVIWIAPREEAEEINFAGMVNSPLPLEIDLRAGKKKYVNVDVLCYDNRLVNYYGYLFEANPALKFCIFGNYCDDNGRHIEAVSYSVNVWTFSGDDDAPKGNVLYQNLKNAIWISDDFENGISETGSEPICIALPDTAGQDQYYFEITVLGGVGSSAPNSLIRRGVITDDDVRSLFDGEDRLHYYHFREGMCTLEDSPNLFDEVTGQPSVVEAIFLPTLQDYFTPRGGVEWVHQYSDEGLLNKTLIYERFPYRLLTELNYSDHNEIGLPQKIDRTSYNPNGHSTPSTIYLTYSGDHTIHTITTHVANSVSKLLITEYDFAYRIIEMRSVSETGDFISRNVRQFDSEGRLQVSTTYSSETGTEDGDIIRRDTFSYTSFGELEVLEQIIDGVKRQIQYFYREDNTLREYISRTYQEEPTIQTAQYDENEIMTFVSIIHGNHRTEYVSFSENGSFNVAHYYRNDFLYRIITYNGDRSSTWKIMEEDSSFRIEYKDASGNIYRVEFYNSDGELITEGS